MGQWVGVAGRRGRKARGRGINVPQLCHNRRRGWGHRYGGCHQGWHFVHSCEQFCKSKATESKQNWWEWRVYVLKNPELWEIDRPKTENRSKPDFRSNGESTSKLTFTDDSCMWTYVPAQLRIHFTRCEKAGVAATENAAESEIGGRRTMTDPNRYAMMRG